MTMMIVYSKRLSIDVIDLVATRATSTCTLTEALKEKIFCFKSNFGDKL